jgi:hypothetical protein
MILWYGVILRPILLGSKWEECRTCGGVTEHAVMRTTTWFHLFRLPILLVGVHHGMKCGRCATWTKIPRKAARTGVKNRVMPLSLPRPSFDELRDDLWTLTGRRPTEADIFDHLEVNPKRGPWDLYTKVWPFLVALLVVGVIAFPRQAGIVVGNPEAKYGEAHQCWLSPTEADAVNGCRMDDGTIVGDEKGVQMTCFFDEPLDKGRDSFWCR